jgi:hypothetical protein
MSETPAETSTESAAFKDLFEAAPGDYEPPTRERRVLADEAMTILMRGRQRSPLNLSAISAEQVIQLAEYLRTGAPLGPDGDSEPEYTLIDIKTVAPGTLFLNAANQQCMVVAPPRIGPVQTTLKHRTDEGYVHEMHYDNATLLRVTNAPRAPEPVLVDAKDLRRGDVYVEAGIRKIIQHVGSPVDKPGKVSVRSNNAADQKEGFIHIFNEDTQIWVTNRRPTPHEEEKA